MNSDLVCVYIWTSQKFPNFLIFVPMYIFSQMSQVMWALSAELDPDQSIGK